MIYVLLEIKSGQFFEFFEILGGAGDIYIYITRQVGRATAMNHIATLVCIYKRYLALGPRFRYRLDPQQKGFGSRGSRSGHFSRFWRFWAGLVIYITRQVRPSPAMKRMATLVCM